MFEYIKKTGVVLGHAICIFILIYSFATTNVAARGEEIQQPEPESIVTMVPTKAPTMLPTRIPDPSPTVAVSTVETPMPEVTLSPTPVPTATVTPTVTPTVAPTAIPTESPTPTQEPTVTPMPTATPIPTVNPEEARAEVKNRVLQNISKDIYSSLDNKSDNWWFRRKQGHVPSGSGEFFNVAEYQGFYINKNVTDEEKVLYLTIDCGYGSSNTAVILDVFKKHNVKVTFFVTGNFLKACPEETKRMVAEGHTVANHSVSHATLTELTDAEIYQEIIGCEEQFYEITGTQMALYFRPPEGAYSKRTMQITEELGYKTIFWSIAYYDYNKNDQPGAAYVLDHFKTYHHNGAVPLMHNDSDSNMEAMDEVITFLKEQGYRFGTLDELK